MFRLTTVRLTMFFALFVGTAGAQVWAAEDSSGGLPTPAWEQKILRGLGRPITLEFEEAPLYEVLEFIEKTAEIPTVLVDARALENVGIGSDTPITRNVRGITLRSALRLMLKELDLTYVLRDGALVITTPEEAESLLITRVFEVLDLVRPHADTPPDEYEYYTIVELITCIIAPTTWTDAGGAGSIGGFRGTLVVSQTQEVLRGIPELLDTLRRAREIVRKHGTAAPPVTSLSIDAQAHDKFGKALAQEGTYEFRETPLCDVVDYIKHLHKIEVQIDTRALADVGIGVDTPITFSAKEMTLSQALRHILKELDLTYVLRDEVLLITTPEESETQLETRVYPVADLISGVLSSPDSDALGFEQADYDDLIQLTGSAVAPTTWVDAGGSGSIEPFSAFGLLVVSQTGEVHAGIEKLFAKLRANIPAKKLAAQQADQDGLRLVVYFVTTRTAVDTMHRPNVPKPRKQPATKTSADAKVAKFMMAIGGVTGMLTDQELLKLLMELVEPASWHADGVFATAAGGRLVIRQTDQVHRKIRRMLSQLQVEFSDSETMKKFRSGYFGGGGMGGMGGGGMGGMGAGGMGGMGGMGGGGGFF